MRKEILILGAVLAVVIIAAVFGSNYYRSSVQSERKSTNMSVTTAPAAMAAPAAQLIRPDSPARGPADAKVTIVEFYDPECESCAAFSPIVEKILKDNEGKVRFAVRYIPRHPNSMTAVAFTEAAGQQGKYWQARELLFQKQPEWGEKHGKPEAVPPDINALFDKYARELGLDLDKTALAIKENRFAAKIERDKEDGRGLGVRGTPTFFVNGRQLMRLRETALRELIDEELKK